MPILILATTKSSCSQEIAEFIASKAEQSIVQIDATYANSSGNNPVLGSGIVISKSGHILTVYHVVQDWLKQDDSQRISHPIIVRFGPNKDPSSTAHLINLDQKKHFALLQIDSANTLSANTLTEATICSSDAPNTDQSLFSYGYPQGNVFTPVRVAFGGESLDDGYWRASAPFDFGMSGGPVYDGRGVVVGLIEGAVGSVATAKIAPLRWAEELVRQLNIRKSCKLEIPLNEALHRGNLRDGNRLVKALDANSPVYKVLADGADPNSYDSEGFTALTRAAYFNDIEAVEALLEAGADPNLPRYDPAVGFQSALSEASAGDRDHLSFAERFHVGENVNNSDQKDAICRAYELTKLRIVRALLASGAKVNGDKRNQEFTPLMDAVAWENCDPSDELLQALLEAGGDINAVRRNGMTTALDLNVSFGRLPALIWLLKNGADPNKRNWKGETPIFQIVDGSRTSSEPNSTRNDTCLSDNPADDPYIVLAFRALIDNGARTDIKNVEGQTPKSILLEKLHGDCKRPQCLGYGQPGYLTCYERMVRYMRHLN